VSVPSLAGITANALIALIAGSAPAAAILVAANHAGSTGAGLISSNTGPTALSGGMDPVEADPVPETEGHECIVGDDGSGDLTGNGSLVIFKSLDGTTWVPVSSNLGPVFRKPSNGSLFYQTIDADNAIVPTPLTLID
jgi:hypothetical protein